MVARFQVAKLARQRKRIARASNHIAITERTNQLSVVGITAMTLEEWYFVISIAGNIVIGGTLIAMIWQFNEMRRQTGGIFQQSEVHRHQATVDRADSYLRRYDDLRPKMEMIYHTLENYGRDDILGLLKNDERVRSNWLSAINYFEDLGTHYNLEHIDKDTIRVSMRALILRMWDLSSPITLELREQRRHPELWIEFEKMCQSLRR